MPRISPLLTSLLLLLLLLCGLVEHSPADEAPIIVEVNAAKETTQKLPAVFYFHGTGGSPNVSFIRSYCDGLPCLLIGMNYTEKGLFVLSDDAIQKEIHHFQKTRDKLMTEHPIDPEKVFVTGFSKGGWISAFIIESDASVAGAAVMGAGALAKMDHLSRDAAQGKPVYIGIGATDKNAINSARLVERMDSLRANPILEVWDGIGHSLPRGNHQATGLRQWLEKQLTPESITPDNTRDWASQHLKDIRAEPDTRQKFMRLTRFRSLPLLLELGAPGQKIIDRELASLISDAAAQDEAAAFSLHRNLIKAELKSRKLSALKGYRKRYLELVKKHPDSITATYSKAEIARLDQVLAGR